MGDPQVMNDAAEVLAALGPDAALDRRAVAAYETARAAGDWDRVLRFGRVGIARRVAPVIARIESDLWDLDDPAAEEALGRLHYGLRAADLIADERVVEAMADPSRARFVRYAAVVKKRGLRAASIARLRAALGSEARGGESAAEAALTLLRARVLRLDDRRLEEVIAGAPAELQVKLMWLRGYLKEAGSEQPRGPLDARTKARVESLLRHPDRAVGMACAEYLEPVHADDEAWLDGVYEALPAGDVRRAVGELLERPSEAELYWQKDEEAEEE